MNCAVYGELVFSSFLAIISENYDYQIRVSHFGHRISAVFTIDTSLTVKSRTISPNIFSSGSAHGWSESLAKKYTSFRTRQKQVQSGKPSFQTLGTWDLWMETLKIQQS